MSLAIESLNLVHVIDPRVDVNARERREYGVLSSGNENSYQTVASTSFSNSQIDWSSANPPNRNIYVNRRAYKRVTFQLQFTGTPPLGIPVLQCRGLPSSTGANLGNQTYDAPRNLPLSRAVTNEKVVMNGLAFTSDSGRWFHGIERYHNPVSNQDGDASMSPSMPDQFQAYSDGNGFARDPLRAYADNPLQCPRGGFIGADVIANGVGDGINTRTATVNLTVTEPIYTSPWLFGEEEEAQSFIGLETLTVSLQIGGRGSGVFSGLVGSLWSHSSLSNSNITSATASVTKADLLFNYITPDLTQQVPPTINYALYNPVLYQTLQSAPVNAGLSTSIPQAAITLTSIPNRMYVWVSAPDSDFSYTSSDAFFSIDNILVKFENRPIQLSDASQQDLYQMSKRNGCNESFRQWTNDVGSVLCIAFGPDLALTPLQAAGMAGKYTMQLTVKCTNKSAGAIAPTLNVLVVEDGVFSISGGKCYATLGPLTEQDVLNAKKEHPVKYKPSSNVYGGAFWDSIVKWAKKFGRAAIDIGKSTPSAYQSYFQAADPIAKAIGFGGPVGVSGGKRLSRTQMMRLLK